MSDQRIDNLIQMYRKFRDKGMITQAKRTLDRIREIGGLEAVEQALEAK